MSNNDLKKIKTLLLELGLFINTIRVTIRKAYITLVVNIISIINHSVYCNVHHNYYTNFI